MLVKNYDQMKDEAYNVGLSSANLSKRDYIVSNDKLEATGWMPQFSLDDGIREFFKFYSFLPVNNYKNVL